MLADIQKEFMNALYRDEANFLKLLKIEKLSCQQQFHIYLHSVQGGLLHALSEIYPVCQKLVGNDFFEAMCLKYIKGNPSTNPDINQYGKHLPEFVRNFHHAQALPYLADVCLLEWHLHQAHQSEPVVMNDLANILNYAEQEILDGQLQLNPTAALMSSHYPVDTIWNSNQNDQPCDFIQIDDGQLMHFIIWRKDVELRIERLDASLFKFLQAVQYKYRLGQLAEAFPDVNTQLIHSLSLGYIYEFCIESGSIV